MDPAALALVILTAPPAHVIRTERGQQVDRVSMTTETPTRHWFSVSNDLLHGSTNTGVSIGGLYEYQYGEITFSATVEVALEQGRERVTVEANPPWIAIPMVQEALEGETMEFLITLRPAAIN